MNDNFAVAEVFGPEPQQWGLRGDPHVWRAMREELASLPRPTTHNNGVELLHHAFRAVVGAGLHDRDTPDMVYVKRFDTGGMSGGWVHVPTWRDRLMPLLESRLANV